MSTKSQLWETEFVNTMKAFTANTKYSNMYYQAERSIQDILSTEIAADTKYIILSYVLMFLYTIIALGRFDFVESKIWIGLSAVSLEILAMVIALGITSAGGVALSPITLQVLPFLVLGIIFQALLIA